MMMYDCCEVRFLLVTLIVFIAFDWAHGWRISRHSINQKFRNLQRCGSSVSSDDSVDSHQSSSAATFKHTNPLSDKIPAERFHHVEYYAGDATSTYKRFMHGLGLDLAAKSDFSTGNDVHASYMLQSGDMRMLITAPYNVQDAAATAAAYSADNRAVPGFDEQLATNFLTTHGFGVRAVAISVGDVPSSFYTMLQHGGRAVLPPTIAHDSRGRGFAEVAEVSLYGDVVLRLVNTDNFRGSFWPNFEDVPVRDGQVNYGRYNLYRYDHIVGNVWNMSNTREYIKNITVSFSVLY